MENYDSLGFLGLVGAMFVALALAVAFGVPLAVFRVAARRNRPSWDTKASAREPAGAYRTASFSWLVRGRLPVVVALASLSTLWALGSAAVALLLVPGATSWPSVDALALAVAMVVVGVRLTRRSAATAGAARLLGAWEIAWALSVALRTGGGAWIVLGLAALHAAVLARAARAHERANFTACT